MSKPLTHLTFMFKDDGTVTVSGADRSADGHLGAIDGLVTWTQMREIGDLIGVRGAIDTTLEWIVDKKRMRVESLESQIATLEKEKRKLAELEDLG